jgi:hypothetical protein
MKRLSTVVLSAVALAACADSSPTGPSDTDANGVSLSRGRNSGTAYVVNSNDAGAGSLRAAIAAANANPNISSIEFRSRLRTIQLRSTVTFSGTQALRIDGEDATIDAAGTGDDGLRFTGGGNLRISDLTVKNAAQEGIEVEVPSTATGTIRVALIDLTISDNGGHGVMVNDQVDQSAPDGQEPPSAGSDASVDVSVIGSRFLRNGFTVSDRDGLRVNEGGLGDLTFSMILSRSEGNAADGIEIDERGTGDVKFSVTGSTIVGNGVFDPEDLDDGFDIDEYGDGSVLGSVSLSKANDNFEEGFDFNENGAGDFRVDMFLVEASGNREEGIDFEEDDDFAGGGDLVTTLTGIKANRNGADGGDGGLKIREKGVGNLTATVKGAETSQNVIGGISIREDALGSLVASITKAVSTGNIGIGIDFDENSDGDLTATVTQSSSTGTLPTVTNPTTTGFGLRADEAGNGVGSATLTTVTLTGNTTGPTTGNVAPTIIP